MTDEILFYSVNDEFGEFSNFASFPIAIGVKRWPTSEHYFQAQKFVDAGDREEVRRAKTPGAAVRLGRSRKKKIRRDWDSLRVSVMWTALEAPFRRGTSMNTARARPPGQDPEWLLRRRSRFSILRRTASRLGLAERAC